MNLGKKQETEYNLGEDVVLNLSHSLRDTYCTLYFDNFFKSPALIPKLFDDGIYGIGTVRPNCKTMRKLPDDKNMKRGDIHYQHFKKMICIKRKVNLGVVFLGSNNDAAADCSSVQRREKGMSSKTSFPCSQLKRCNKEMGGVDLMDQLTYTYRLDRRFKTPFYLPIFFLFLGHGFS